MKLLISFFVFLLTVLTSVNAVETPKKNILVGSPIRQHPEVLKEFLLSLEEVTQDSFIFDYCFVDDNTDPASTKMLKEFEEKHIGHCLLLSPDVPAENSCYIVNEHGHVWTAEVVWKVAAFKDRIIEIAKEKDYDYLFLIDSDLVMHPKTIEQLLAANKGIVSNIFWTSWQPGTFEMPQVWMQDEYNFYEVHNNRKPSAEEIGKEMWAFMDKLRVPGTYEVGGLGACTLIDRETLLKGVSFKKVKNVSFWGEDRHFCIRAAARDIPLFVDTHYPAYHIYRPSALGGVEEYKNKYRSTPTAEVAKPRITLSMIMKNEGERYLREVLTAAKEYITDAVIIDDGSTDNSVAIVKEVLKGIPLTLIQNDQSKFGNECLLREQQWNETVKTNPQWILCLDADEIFETKFKDQVSELVANPLVDAYYFRLYDFWDKTHYRDDQYWQAHNVYRPFLIRYNPGMKYSFKQAAQHCGRFPLEVSSYTYQLSNLRLKHFGWENNKDREAKYKRYQELDPGARYGWKEQYESILDPHPHLVAWQE